MVTISVGQRIEYQGKQGVVVQELPGGSSQRGQPLPPNYLVSFRDGTSGSFSAEEIQRSGQILREQIAVTSGIREALLTAPPGDYPTIREPFFKAGATPEELAAAGVQVSRAQAAGAIGGPAIVSPRKTDLDFYERQLKAGKITQKQYEYLKTYFPDAGRAGARIEPLKDVLARETAPVPTSLTLAGPYIGPGGIQITEAELTKIQQTRAEKVAGEIPKTRAGEREFFIGERVVTKTPTMITETVMLGGQVYTRSLAAPAGATFSIAGPSRVVDKISASVTIPKGAVEPFTSDAALKQAGKFYAQATPAERIALRARTLFSPRGYELIGASVQEAVGIRPAVSSQQLAVSKFAEEIKLSHIETPSASQVRIATEFLESPVFEMEAGLAVGAGFGKVVTSSAKIARAVGTRAGKAALATTTAALTAPRVADIGVSLQTGQVSRAVGLGLTTAGTFAAVGVGYRAVKPKAPPSVTRLKAVRSVTRETIKIKTPEIKTPKESVFITKIEKGAPSKELISTKYDIKGLAKAGKLVTEKIPVRIEKIKPGGGKTIVKITQTSVDISKPEVYVKREIGTGRFAEFGKPVTKLREIGLKAKFGKPAEKLITLEGAKKAVSAQITQVGPKGFRAYRTTGVYEILKPTSALKVKELQVSTKLIGRQLKGTAGTQIKEPSFKSPEFAGRGIRAGFTIEEPRLMEFGARPRFAGQAYGLKAGFKPLMGPVRVGGLSEIGAKTLTIPKPISPIIGTREITDTRYGFGVSTAQRPVITTETKTTTELKIPPPVEPITTEIIETPPPPIFGGITLGAKLALPKLGVSKFGTKIRKNPVPELPVLKVRV